MLRSTEEYKTCCYETEMHRWAVVPVLLGDGDFNREVDGKTVWSENTSGKTNTSCFYKFSKKARGLMNTQRRPKTSINSKASVRKARWLQLHLNVRLTLSGWPWAAAPPRQRWQGMKWFPMLKAVPIYSRNTGNDAFKTNKPLLLLHQQNQPIS